MFQSAALKHLILFVWPGESRNVGPCSEELRGVDLVPVPRKTEAGGGCWEWKQSGTTGNIPQNSWDGGCEDTHTLKQEKVQFSQRHRKWTS